MDKFNSTNNKLKIIMSFTATEDSKSKGMPRFPGYVSSSNLHFQDEEVCKSSACHNCTSATWNNQEIIIWAVENKICFQYQ